MISREKAQNTQNQKGRGRQLFALFLRLLRIFMAKNPFLFSSQ